MLSPIHIFGRKDKLGHLQRGGDLATRLKIKNAHISFDPLFPLLEIHCSDNFTHKHIKYVQEHSL